jgi:protein phosphatase 4 regulatory subunit 3
VASLTLLSPVDTELSLAQHLELVPDLLNYPRIEVEEAEPAMMAQPVPHQSTDRKRVKVYELRNNDWFDRGTGFCAAAFVPVRHTPPSRRPQIRIVGKVPPQPQLYPLHVSRPRTDRAITSTG